MNLQEKTKRTKELAKAIDCQESLLDLGSRRLQELNNRYDTLDREYKLLLSKKKSLLEEIITLAENLELYSNF